MHSLPSLACRDPSLLKVYMCLSECCCVAMLEVLFMSAITWSPIQGSLQLRSNCFWRMSSDEKALWGLFTFLDLGCYLRNRILYIFSLLCFFASDWKHRGRERERVSCHRVLLFSRSKPTYLQQDSLTERTIPVIMASAEVQRSRKAL